MDVRGNFTEGRKRREKKVRARKKEGKGRKDWKKNSPEIFLMPQQDCRSENKQSTVWLPDIGLAYAGISVENGPFY